MQVSQSAVEFREPKRREKLFLHLDLEEEKGEKEDFLQLSIKGGRERGGGFAKGKEKLTWEKSHNVCY